MSVREVVADVGEAVDLAGVAVMVGGIVAAGVLTAARDRASSAWYSLLRRRVGRAILLGLEVLVAADIIRTVAVDPTLESAAVLGVIVLIRTFLSFSLEVELEGRVPWAHARGSATTSDAAAPQGGR